MYVHGCANPIKYLYLQGHFSKRDFREMSFLLWSNNIRMEESIMTDTALRSGAQLKEYGKSGELTLPMVRLILTEEKPKERKVTYL